MLRLLTPHHRHFATVAAVLAVVALPVNLVGCAGDEESAQESVAAQQPVVDPRYASADALIAEFNRMTTTEPVDVAGMLNLYYAENALQRDWTKSARGGSVAPKL